MRIIWLRMILELMEVWNGIDIGHHAEGFIAEYGT
jgi:hypothetical protein